MNNPERFTVRARRILSFAHQETENARSLQIETEHLLLGLIRESEGVANRILTELGLSELILRANIKLKDSSNFNPEMITLSIGVQEVLEKAVDEARRFKHHYIGTEHILLGITCLDCTAMNILKEFGITKEKIRDQVNLILSETKSQVKEPRTQQVYLWSENGTDFINAVAEYIEDLKCKSVFFEENTKDPQLVFHQLEKIASEVDFVIIYISSNDLKFSELNTEHKYLNPIYQIGFFHAKLSLRKVCVLIDRKLDAKEKKFLKLIDAACIIVNDEVKWEDNLYNKMIDAGLSLEKKD